MQGELIKEALLETGWKSSFAFPTASKENIQLLELLTETKAKISETTSGLELFTEKNRRLEEHINLVKSERSLTEHLKEEVDKEIADSEHFIKMAEQENWRTASDHKRLIEQKKKLMSRLGALEDEIFLKSNELTSIKTELDCDQKMVEQFMTDCETDYALKKRLQSISKNDNTMIEHLTSEENKLSARRNELIKKLDTAVSKNEVLQLRIDTTSEMGREENRGRQEMLQLWEKTVKQLSDRDADFSRLGHDYDELLSDISERATKLHAMQRLLGSINQDIKDIKNKSSMLNKEASGLRESLRQENSECTTTESELLTLKKLVSKSAQDLQQLRAANSHLKNSNSRLAGSLLFTEDVVKQTFNKLESLKTDNLTAEEMLRMVEEELEEEVKCQNTIKAKLTKLKNQRFAISEEKLAAQNDNKTVGVMITGSKAKIRQSDRELQKSEMELERLENLVYKAMLAVNLMERRIARMESSPSYDEEGRALERRVKQMQEQLDSQSQSVRTLTAMIEQFTNEKRVLRLQTENLRDQMQKCIYQMDGAKVYLANAGRSLEANIRDRNELLVFYNLSRYQLRRAEERRRLTEETTLSAETRAKAIATLTRELEEEAAARAAHVEAEMRLTGQDASRVKADLARRQCRLDQLKSRYDVEASKISAYGDMAEAQTHIILKSIEEHNELQARGDELDKEVKKAEEELRALENTVHVMTSLNESARSYAGNLIDKSLIKSKEEMRIKLQEAENRLKITREKRRILRASVLRFTVEISSLDEEISQLEKLVASYDADIFRIQSKNDELAAKLERASKVQTLAKTKATRVKQPVDLDIEVQLLTDFNESVNVLMVRSIKASPSINEEILTKSQELFKQFQITAPILISSTDNTKPSDRSNNRSSNANASRHGYGGGASARVLELSAEEMFGAISTISTIKKTPLSQKTAARRDLKSASTRTTSAASTCTLSIRSTR